MKTFLRHILIPVIALILISLVIWFAGPLLSFAGWAPLEHPYWRLFLILIIVGWWVIRKTRAWMIGRRYNRELAQQVVESEPEHDAGSEEVSLLQERLREAIDVLKNARLGGKGERKQLYQIPWYLIIGPPGSGKTTALVNSGLNFPLAERFGVESLKGVGGTRHCDWWFTDEAVLIDTAGRYTTQDSDRTRDAKAWTGFLQLLKRYRKRQPINGALVAISIADLVSVGEEGMRAHAQAVRSRLQELQSELGIQFPVYVVFTKCDLLAGFNEFFDDLGRSEREQVWGMTFDLAQSNKGLGTESLSGEFTALTERLSGQVIDKLRNERSEDRRRALYRFPQQFASIRPLLEQFASTAFAPSRYEQPIQVRGMYFTSATQEGTPIDRVMGAISRSFGLQTSAAPLAAGRGRSYFLTGLLKNVVFSEAALAGIDLKGERRRRLLKWASIGTTAAVVVLAMALWTISFSNNRALVERLEQETAEARVRFEDFSETAPSLDDISRMLGHVRDLPTGYSEREVDPPMLAGMGLYQGEKLGRVTQDAYVRLLHKMLLPQLIYRIEDRLYQNIDAQEFLYETLKVYLMMERPERYDAEQVNSWFQFDLERFPPDMLDEQHYLMLFEHADALFANLELPIPYQLDEELVAEVRQVLRAVPLAQRVLERLEIEADYARDVPPFRVDEAAGSQAGLVFERISGLPLDAPLNGLYTWAGYHDLFKPELREIALSLLNETWVIGDEDRSTLDAARELAALINEVRTLYFDTYADKWQELLEDLQIAAFAGNQQAVQVLRAASGTQSPIRRLVGAVQRQTMLSQTDDAAGEVAAAASEAGGRIAARRLSRLLPDDVRNELPSSGAAADGGRGSPAEDRVETRFEALARLAGDGDPATDWPIDQSLSLVRRLAVTFEDSVRGTSSGLGSTADLTRDLRENALMLPDPVSRWMQSLSRQVTQLSASDRGSEIQRSWASRILPICREVTNQRFPFVASSPVDLSIQEFGRVFGHDGLIDEFLKTEVLSRMDTTRRPWRWRSTDPIASRFSPDSARMFERARDIRDAFFPTGGQQLALQLDFRPVEMDQSIDRLTLNIGDQSITYFHGPVRTTTVRWPDQARSSEVRLQLDPAVDGGRSSFIKDGPWALLRFLDHFVQTEGDAPEAIVVDMSLGDRGARYRIASQTLINPLTSDLLQGFRCPSDL
ncbi:MAG: type VI secretion system membrane subunit TssM [Wenzhouxiangella sp.]|jgi:type VI secretion system protein ImpL|nr:type VI secretion system membrane subunit TssM [Wenzhouxiangella sp.]